MIDLLLDIPMILRRVPSSLSSRRNCFPSLLTKAWNPRCVPINPSFDATITPCFPSFPGTSSVTLLTDPRSASALIPFRRSSTRFFRQSSTRPPPSISPSVGLDHCCQCVSIPIKLVHATTPPFVPNFAYFPPTVLFVFEFMLWRVLQLPPCLLRGETAFLGLMSPAPSFETCVLGFVFVPFRIHIFPHLPPTIGRLRAPISFPS